ncbi:MAG: hypothetical protein QM640_16130 [Niabella sp.]
MFADYTKLILQDYEKKREANALSITLLHPSPAKLKDECQALCNSRYERKKDEIALHGFFGQGYDRAAVLKEISRCDIDKFKPLVKFLRKETASTDKKNIELLAWLIDFKDRPFEYGKKYPDSLDSRNVTMANITEAIYTESAEQTIASDQQVEVKEQPQTVTVMERGLAKPRLNFKTITALIVAAILTLAGIITYQNSRNGAQPNVMGATFNNREACMYWAGDHYQQISCSQKVYGALVIALDPEKLLYFKKITRPDTIKKEDIDKVWYAKIKGKIEFYTADGYHPTELKLRLKPVTDYIFNKYIYPESE